MSVIVVKCRSYGIAKCEKMWYNFGNGFDYWKGKIWQKVLKQ